MNRVARTSGDFSVIELLVVVAVIPIPAAHSAVSFPEEHEKYQEPLS